MEFIEISIYKRIDQYLDFFFCSQDGKKFIIDAKNNSPENVYIQSGTLNGKPYSHNWLTYGDIVKGGILRFEMGNKPSMQRGLALENKPFSLTK